MWKPDQVLFPWGLPASSPAALWRQGLPLKAGLLCFPLLPHPECHLVPQEASFPGWQP